MREVGVVAANYQDELNRQEVGASCPTTSPGEMSMIIRWYSMGWSRATSPVGDNHQLISYDLRRETLHNVTIKLDLDTLPNLQTGQRDGMASFLLLLKHPGFLQEKDTEVPTQEAVKLLLWPFHHSAAEGGRVAYRPVMELHTDDRSGDGIRSITGSQRLKRAPAGDCGLRCRGRLVAASQQQTGNKGAGKQKRKQCCR